MKLFIIDLRLIFLVVYDCNLQEFATRRDGICRKEREIVELSRRRPNCFAYKVRLMREASWARNYNFIGIGRDGKLLLS